MRSAWFLVSLLGCDDGKQGDDSTTPTDTACTGGVPVTWEGDIEAIITAWCQPCHASDAPNRHDAPESVTFDSEAEVIERADRVYAVTNVEDPSMPPGLSMNEHDTTALHQWLVCEVGVEPTARRAP